MAARKTELLMKSKVYALTADLTTVRLIKIVQTEKCIGDHAAIALRVLNMAITSIPHRSPIDTAV
ncbi:hypothetical protein GQE99_10260 [Maritimibacter sp. DP07]|uniref:Uncharacterized protein n=1 Tax=Maritimibacter harenae TaxID=2606218 RepID=A0A845M308_9RHOB|nr:hypothetical protein [Maritimibacter harenae]MZR13399.1 hypothetical protein [Maritimibacter harenae]